MDENVDGEEELGEGQEREEGEEGEGGSGGSSPRKRSARGSSLLQSRVLARSSSDPEHQEGGRILHNHHHHHHHHHHPSGATTTEAPSSRLRFSDVTRDQYSFSSETTSRSQRGPERNNNNNSQKRQVAVDRSSVPGCNRCCPPGRCDPSSPQLGSRESAVTSYLLEHLGNICFVLFLLLSVLISGIFFLKNI